MTSKPVSKFLLLGVLPGLAILLLVVLIGAANGFDLLPPLMVEPAETMMANPFTGLVSTLGVFVWVGTAAICAFCASLLGRRGERESSRFLGFAAAITAYVAFDDFFQMHEIILPSIGLVEKYTYLTLGAGVVYFLYRYRSLVLAGPVLILIASLGLLGLSVIVDTIHERAQQLDNNWMTFAEEALKWLGLICWSGFFTHMAMKLAAGNAGAGDHTAGE